MSVSSGYYRTGLVKDWMRFGYCTYLVQAIQKIQVLVEALVVGTRTNLFSDLVQAFAQSMVSV
jgi:hypothetical protein